MRKEIPNLLYRFDLVALFKNSLHEICQQCTSEIGREHVKIMVYSISSRNQAVRLLRGL